MDFDRHASRAEQLRTKDLIRLMPAEGRCALDIGARDGHFTVPMADRFEKVTALDLTAPNIPRPKIVCVEGNATQLSFHDDSFDFVLCAEVLEHIPPADLLNACSEIERVSSHQLLIGVPYKQDVRVARTTCYSCGKTNPPWGHINSFDERYIEKLFPHCSVQAVSFIGEDLARTNWLACVFR